MLRKPALRPISTEEMGTTATGGDRGENCLWRPLPILYLWRTLGWRNGRFRLLIGLWVAVSMAGAFSSVYLTYDGPACPPIHGWQPWLTFSPPVILFDLLLFGLGFEWAVAPSFIAVLASALAGGISLHWSLVIALSLPVGLAIQALGYRALALSIDLRSRRSLIWFAGLSAVATVAGSTGAFVWSEAANLKAADTFDIWQGWMLGTFLGSLVLVAPALRLGAARWYRFRARLFPEPPPAESSFEFIARSIAAAGLVIAVFLAAAGQLATSRLHAVLGRDLPPDVRSEIWDAVASWRVSSISVVVMIVAITVGAVALAHWWARRWELQRQVLIEATRRAEEASRVKNDFLAMISHELRTPMNGILGMHDLLASTALTPEQSRYAGLASESARHLLGLLNDLLDLSKIEAGKLDIRDEPFDLRRQIALATDLPAAKAAAANLDFSVTIEDGLPSIVSGDDDRLRQILVNLIGNAIKFTARGSVSLSVAQVAKSASSVTLRFSIEDTGPGIAPEALPGLFQPFTQGSSSLSRRFGGTGLGLSICRQLTQRMGGHISAQSKLGEGSTFSFSLPFRLPLETVPVQFREEDSAAAPTFPGVRVLLAEDNVVNQIVAARFLERLGCVVEIATDGRQVMERWGPGQYDLVLMDCQMPYMDGLEAARAIRARESSAARTPIVALTANAMPEDHRRCLDAGMDDYLAKPVSMLALREALARAMPSQTVPAQNGRGVAPSR